jgi:hypothetical protein
MGGKGGEGRESERRERRRKRQAPFIFFTPKITRKERRKGAGMTWKCLRRSVLEGRVDAC